MRSQPNYSVTEVVWAKIRGYPWWPAIISNVQDDDPDDVQFKVNFFGDSTHSFLDESKIAKFQQNYTQYEAEARNNKKLIRSILEAEEHLKEKAIQLNLVKKPTKVKLTVSRKESSVSKVSSSIIEASSSDLPKEIIVKNEQKVRISETITKIQVQIPMTRRNEQKTRIKQRVCLKQKSSSQQEYESSEEEEQTITKPKIQKEKQRQRQNEIQRQKQKQKEKQRQKQKSKQRQREKQREKSREKQKQKQRQRQIQRQRQRQKQKQRYRIRKQKQKQKQKQKEVDKNPAKSVQKIKVTNIINANSEKQIKSNASNQKNSENQMLTYPILAQKLKLRMSQQQSIEKVQRRQKFKDLLQQVTKYATSPEQIINYIGSLDITIENIKQILDCDVVDILHNNPSQSSTNLINKMRQTLLDRYFSEEQQDVKTKPNQPKPSNKNYYKKKQLSKLKIRQQTIESLEDILKNEYYNLKIEKANDEAHKLEEQIFDKDKQCGDDYQEYVGVLIDQLELNKYSIKQLNDFIEVLASNK